MIQTQPLEVENFTGGITDYFVDGRPDQAEIMDNFFLNPNRKPFTRWGSELFLDAQIPLGQFRVSKLEFLNDVLFTFAERRIYEGVATTPVSGPGGGNVFSVGDTNSIITSSEWQGQLFLTNDSYSSPQKLYRDDAGQYQLRNAGLPPFNSTGLSLTPTTGTAESYLYSFVYKYTYQVDDVTYTDRSAVYQSEVILSDAIDVGNPVNITLPTILASVENWDEANIEKEIYRSTNGGVDFFLLATVPMSQATYVDEALDADITNGLGLYTNQGALPSLDAPPKSKYVHVVNNLAYYGNLQTDASDDEYLVRQSVPGDPDSVPESFFARAEQRITAVTSIFDRPIVMCEKYIYRIDNIITASGTGNMDLRRIDDRAGCVSQNSVVRTSKSGLFWAGDVGFYWSDGFLVKHISTHLNDTYKAFVQNADRRRRIQGTYDPSNERVIWSVCRDDGTNEPDMCMVLDLKWFDPNSDTNPFTTLSGGTSFRPTALAENNNFIYRGDTRGYVFEHRPDLFSDPRIDVIINPSLWERQTIIHTYKSCFLDFGSKFMRKIVTRLLISAENKTNLSLALGSSNDNNRVTGDLAPIRYTSNITWGDDLPLWGEPTAQWNAQGLVEEWRRFPARGLRCNYKQVTITNAEVIIVNSELLGQVTVDPVNRTATLSGTSRWLNDSVDYFISFSHDDCQEKFKILQRTDTSIVFEDNQNTAPTGNFDWQIVGQPKGEVLLLNGYVIHWAMLSKSHTPFSAGSLRTFIA